MLTWLATSDFERLQSAGHNLKGTGASYGFTELTQLGASIEHSAAASDSATLETTLYKLGMYLESIELPPAQPQHIGCHDPIARSL